MSFLRFTQSSLDHQEQIRVNQRSGSFSVALQGPESSPQLPRVACFSWGYGAFVHSPCTAHTTACTIGR